MKTIKGIRIYKSTIENIDGNSHPSVFAERTLNATIHRIVMKLRESNFSLGDFDHLYLNFTTCLPNGRIEPAKRSIDCYHPWYRYYDVGVQSDIYETLGARDHADIVINCLRDTLIRFFTNTNSKQIVDDCITAALHMGENMKMRYKEKRAAKNHAVIFLRYLDSGMYSPLLCVYNLDGEEIFHTDLPQTMDLRSLGEIQLSSKRITIKPRKNACTEKLKPITYEL